MKIDAIALLLLTHKKWHKCQLAAKQGVRSVDSEGASDPFRVRSQGMDISWCAKHAEECVLDGQPGGGCLAAGMCKAHSFF